MSDSRRFDPANLIIGVDGGGSKTSAALAVICKTSKNERGFEILGRGKSGSSNIRSVGKEKALKNLALAISMAFQDSELESVCVNKACFGLAGADRDEEKQLVRSWAQEYNLATIIQGDPLTQSLPPKQDSAGEGVAKSIVVVNDALPVLYAANSTGEGIALISGTGSLAFGRDSTGRTERCGGWGPLFGDEGSGYWIAIEGLRHAARCWDGRGPETTLLRRLMQELNIDDGGQLISKIYGEALPRDELARLSTVIFEAASEKDPAAISIIQHAGHHLSEMANTVASKIFVNDSLTIALSGGVLVSQGMMRDSIEQHLRQLISQTVLFRKIDDPVEGALIIASQDDVC